MCGFAGLYLLDLHEAPTALRARIDAMVATIAHRGPDDSTALVLPFAGVGFRRLSIVDLQTGGQPVHNRDGTIHVFLNGEIYNHDDLRRQLRAEHGIDVRGGSDAAVLPHLYECHGERFVELLNGMFAICVVDERDHSVRIYRDRLGIKPLYVARTPRAIVFGSELKPIWRSGLVPAAIDTRQVVPFLDLFYVPGRATLAVGIEKVMPGECLVMERAATRTFRYWSLAQRREMAHVIVLERSNSTLQTQSRRQHL